MIWRLRALGSIVGEAMRLLAIGMVLGLTIIVFIAITYTAIMELSK